MTNRISYGCIVGWTEVVKTSHYGWDKFLKTMWDGRKLSASIGSTLQQSVCVLIIMPLANPHQDTLQHLLGNCSENSELDVTAYNHLKPLVEHICARRNSSWGPGFPWHILKCWITSNQHQWHRFKRVYSATSSCVCEKQREHLQRTLGGESFTLYRWKEVGFRGVTCTGNGVGSGMDIGT